MRWIIIVLLIFVAIILILKYPVPIKIKIFINLYDMKAYYSIKVAWIKLLCGKTEIDEKQLSVQNTNDILAKIDDKKRKQEGLFVNEILKKIQIGKLEMYFNFGISTAQDISAIICGLTSIVMGMISAKAINKNKTAKVLQNVTLENQDILEATIYSTLTISVDEIVSCKIIANKKHKELSNGK